MTHDCHGSSRSKIKGVQKKNLDSQFSTPSDSSKHSLKSEAHSIPPPNHCQTERLPRCKKRGLFATLALLREIPDPREYTKSKKWFITFIVAVAGSAGPMGSAILFPALKQVSKDLKTSQTLTNLSIALYMLALSIFPLWWSSFSELLGRRTIYLVSFALFLLWSVLSAISSSITMLIIMRILSGGASASVQAVGAGTIADIWEVKERGRAMGIFYLGPLCGPLLAPIVGGAVAQKWGWRSTQWTLAIFGGVVLILVLFGLPETLKRDIEEVPDVHTQNFEHAITEKELDNNLPALVPARTGQSLHVKTKKLMKLAHYIFIDPLKIILLLRFPAVLLTVYYASITFGSLYILSVSIQKTFSSPPYGYDVIIVGLLYLPNSIGYVLASIFGGRWTDHIMQREAEAAGRYDEQGKPIYLPEDRMRENAWFGAIMYPVALIWYGWTAERGVFWVVPMIANFFFGVGSMIIFAMATTMLTEFMPKRASNGVAVNNFVRNIFSAAGAIVADPLIDVIGDGWLFTILGAWSLLSCTVIWAMRRYGSHWRKRMGNQMD